ncbi:response regulator transcription factor [uncultured Secundilactobacillus sp.]|uniref:winged helix-turn-helix transcriptional regulator n=1 Tax=uncultured Secundilactobacillus sp. TaxID=2813935 RepID=UPI00258E4E98|nr:response regulator transcription factor [uncultured Secundilactobacillus sp.]
MAMSREIVLVTTNLALVSQLQQALNPRQMTIQSRFDPQLKSVGRQLTLIIDLAAHFAYGQLADQLREFRRSAGGPVIGYLPNELVATASMADLFTTYQLDEVLTEKMTTDEWAARIRQKEWVYAQLNLTDQPSRLTVGHLRIDPRQFRVWHRGVQLPISKREYRLLLFFVQHQNVVLSRSQLAEGVWGSDRGSTMRAVDAHISRLRQLIEDDPKHPQLLRTVRGFGYILSESDGTKNDHSQS